MTNRKLIRLFDFRSVNNFASITSYWAPSIQTEPRAKQLAIIPAYMYLFCSDEQMLTFTQSGLITISALINRCVYIGYFPYRTEHDCYRGSLN
jgi:hypothetical protein